MNTYTSTNTYTSPLQSVALGKFLPLESADMYYHTYPSYKCWHGVPNIGKADLKDDQMPCWSLAALLDVLPKIINNETLFIETSAALWHIGYRNVYIARADNPVDACVEMILKLQELNLL